VTGVGSAVLVMDAILIAVLAATYADPSRWLSRSKDTSGMIITVLLALMANAALLIFGGTA